jgi:hypothetical protein
MPPVEFEPTIAAGERPYTYALDRVATGTDIERNILSKNWIKQLHTLPVLHFDISLTTEYNERKEHFNGNFDIDNKIYVP